MDPPKLSVLSGAGSRPGRMRWGWFAKLMKSSPTRLSAHPFLVLQTPLDADSIRIIPGNWIEPADNLQHALLLDMATRSRNGCIDCKQAKVKCDEVHPSCGTCARRRRQCRGYRLPQPRSAARAGARRASVISAASGGSSEDGSEGRSELSWAPATDNEPGDGGSTFRGQRSPIADSPASTEMSGCHSVVGYPADYSTATATTILEISTQWLSPLVGPSFIPLSEIVPEDKPFIEIYFLKHPAEFVMNNDFFIDEMNGAVISLLQKSPTVVGESLCAIGENYVKEATGNALVSNRKTRLLSRLRSVNEDGGSLELVLLLLLALCGAELTDRRPDSKGNTLPALIENVALILEFHTRSGKELSVEAKYFARGVARQDLLISLARMQRPRISPSLWLDEYSMSHADRLLGLTASLTPILSKLAALAEDVQAILDGCSINDGMHMIIDSNDFLTCRSELVDREAAIRAQLVVWRPIHDSSLSMQTSRKLLLHAAAWKAAALLYLFRIFNRPGSSPSADQIALSMAYEVMMHISGTAEDIKLSLWPLFVAACELEQVEDRDIATKQFKDICRARPTVTANQTMSFCVDQIWPARDRGETWDWMHLSRRGSNLFMPL